MHGAARNGPCQARTATAAGCRALREGDIINVDVTVFLNGYHGDTSRTFYVGQPSPNAQRLVEATEEALKAAIKAGRYELLSSCELLGRNSSILSALLCTKTGCSTTGWHPVHCQWQQQLQHSLWATSSSWWYVRCTA
jgi:hypothetical protein